MTAAAVNPLLRNSSASLARTRCKWSHLKAETKVSYNTWFKTLRVSHSFLCISSAALGLLHKRLKTRHNRASHHRCVNPNTYAEAICRCSLLGLSERCGGFGGLTTAGGATGKDILLLPEPTKSSREKKSLHNDVTTKWNGWKKCNPTKSNHTNSRNYCFTHAMFGALFECSAFSFKVVEQIKFLAHFCHWQSTLRTVSVRICLITRFENRFVLKVSPPFKSLIYFPINQT